MKQIPKFLFHSITEVGKYYLDSSNNFQAYINILPPKFDLRYHWKPIQFPQIFGIPQIFPKHIQISQSGDKFPKSGITVTKREWAWFVGIPCKQRQVGVSIYLINQAIVDLVLQISTSGFFFSILYIKSSFQWYNFNLHILCESYLKQSWNWREVNISLCTFFLRQYLYIYKEFCLS